MFTAEFFDNSKAFLTWYSLSAQNSFTLSKLAKASLCMWTAV